MIVRKVRVDCRESPPTPLPQIKRAVLSHPTSKVRILSVRARASLLFKWEAPLDDFTDFSVSLKCPEWKQSLLLSPNNINISRSLFSGGSSSGVTIHHCTAQSVPTKDCPRAHAQTRTSGGWM